MEHLCARLFLTFSCIIPIHCNVRKMKDKGSKLDRRNFEVKIRTYVESISRTQPLGYPLKQRNRRLTVQRR